MFYNIFCVAAGSLLFQQDPAVIKVLQLKVVLPVPEHLSLVVPRGFFRVQRSDEGVRMKKRFPMIPCFSGYDALFSGYDKK